MPPELDAGLTDGGRPRCVIKAGERLSLDGGDLGLLQDCELESGVVIDLDAEEEAPKLDESKQVEAAPTPPAEDKSMSEKKAEKAVEAVREQSAPAKAVEQAEAAAAETAAKAQAVVEQVPHVADLKSALPAAADTNMLTVVMAGIAVLGGGAAFKFYQNFSAQKHEQSMKKLELDQKRQEEQGKECKAHAGAALELSAIKSRLDEVEEALEEATKKLKEVDEKASKKGSVSFGDMDADELVEKLERVEKKVKKLDREIHDDGDKA